MAKKITTEDVAASSTDDIVDALKGKKTKKSKAKGILATSDPYVMNSDDLKLALKQINAEITGTMSDSPGYDKLIQRRNSLELELRKAITSKRIEDSSEPLDPEASLKAMRERGTKRAAESAARLSEEGGYPMEKEVASTTEGGTPRQQLQKMFDSLTAEEKVITEKTKSGFLKTVARELANEKTTENVFKRLIVDLGNRKVGKKFVAKADAPEGVPAESTGGELAEDVPPTEAGAKAGKTKGTPKSRLQSSINHIRDQIRGGKDALIGGKNIPPEIFSRLEKMATESKTKLLSGEGLDIHPEIEKMTDAEASAFGENLKQEVAAHYAKVDKEGRKVYQGRVKAAPKSKNDKIVEILEKEKATGKMGFGGKAAIGVGLGALGMLGLKQAFGDDGRATQQIRERAQQEQLNQKSRQIADYLEQARATQDTEAMKSRLAQSSPDLYTSIMAGRRVPRGSVVLGGQPRDDLMQQLVASMNQRG